MRSLSHRIALASLVVVALASHARATTDSIGAASAITTTVSGTIDARSAALKTGDAVFANETIVTDANGVGQFQFNDQTKLAIGPGSIVKLDNFVYD